MNWMNLGALLMGASLALTGCGDDANDEIVGFRPESDQCLAQSDRDLVATLVADAGVGTGDGGIGHSEVARIQEHCARSVCFSEVIGAENPPVCLRDCLQTTAAGGLSAGCVDCYVFAVTCGAERCAVTCLTGTDDQCRQCSEENCQPILDDCLGYVL